MFDLDVRYVRIFAPLCPLLLRPMRFSNNLNKIGLSRLKIYLGNLFGNFWGVSSFQNIYLLNVSLISKKLGFYFKPEKIKFLGPL